MYFVDIEKAFDRIPRKVMEWAMRKKGVSGFESLLACMMVQRQESGWDLHIQQNSKYRLVCINDLCCHHYCLQ